MVSRSANLTFWSCQSPYDIFEFSRTHSARPSSSKMSLETFGRHDVEDVQLVDAARLIFEMVIPTEDEGVYSLENPDSDVSWLRNLFEKAVLGFYEAILSESAWNVSGGQTLRWQVGEQSPGIGAISPQMQTAGVLLHPSLGEDMCEYAQPASRFSGGVRLDL